MSGSQSHGPALVTPSGLAVRRAVTVPARLLPLETRTAEVEIGSADGIETLFVHPSARIISFSTTSSPATPSPSRAAGSPREAGTLSWTTPTERTLAAGLLEIYRVPGSVSFLHSGSLLHAILPKSQCWCVDGVSVFAFRVLPNQYYRIELPGKTEQDLQLVEEMKVTLQKVLHYERTACPFRRGFSVELPETPQVIKQSRPKSMLLPAKKWKKRDIWRPEDDQGWTPTPFSTPEVKRPQSRLADAGVATEIEHSTLDSSDHTVPDESEAETPKPSRVAAAAALIGTRSVTAPSLLTKHISAAYDRDITATIPASEAAPGTFDTQNDITNKAVKDQAQSTSTAQTTANTATESAPRTPQEQILDPTLSPESQATDLGAFSEDDVVEGRIWAGISTPSLSSDSEENSWEEVNTPPETLRRRGPRNTAKTIEPATPTVTKPVDRRSSQETSPALRDGIVRKTVGMVFGPPAHLVTIMLKIAARFSNGAFNFTIRSPAGSPQKVPGSWYLGDEEEWELDDYGFTTGIPGGAQRRALSRSASRSS